MRLLFLVLKIMVFIYNCTLSIYIKLEILYIIKNKLCRYPYILFYLGYLIIFVSYITINIHVAYVFKIFVQYKDNKVNYVAYV